MFDSGLRAPASQKSTVVRVSDALKTHDREPKPIVHGYAAWRRIADQWSKKKADDGLSPRAIFWAVATAIGCGLIILGSVGWAITDNSSYLWAYPIGLVVGCVAGVRCGYAIGLYGDEIEERAAATALLTGTTDVTTRIFNGTLCSRISRCKAEDCTRANCPGAVATG